MSISNSNRIKISGSQVPLRIAVVSHALRVAGALSVGKNLVASLQRVAPEHTYLFLLPAQVGCENLDLDAETNEILFYKRTVGKLGRFFFDTFKMPRMIRDFEPDLILALGNQGAGIPGYPQAILCHDAHLFYPVKYFAAETFLKKMKKVYLKWKLGRDLRHTQLLLCQTPVTEKRMVKTFSYKGKTAICPNAVSSLTIKGSTVTEIPGLLAPYAEKFKMLCLTRYYPHKNIEAIVDLFDKYPDEMQECVAVITISKEQHPHAGKLLARISRLGLKDKIINVGPLPQEELAGYFENCQALLMPTTLESFSGTYLEAMHFGLPVLTSDLDFAHDVCADAALYFDPWDISSIKDSVLKLKQDMDTRRKLIENGSIQLKSKFISWDQIAGNVIKELEKTFENKRDKLS